MTRFLSKELYNEVDDLIERLDDLREILVDARDATSYEDFNDLMDTAYQRAGEMQYDTEYIQAEGTALHSNEEEEDED